MSDTTYEFSDLTPEAVDCCIEFGASNLKGYLSDVAFDAIATRGFPTSQESAKLIDERLFRLMEVFGIGGLPGVQAENSILPRADMISAPGKDSSAHLDWHQDSDPRNGISLLMPLSGEVARFEFRETRSAIGGAVEYGPKDVLLLRQYIARYNGVDVMKNQVEHRGLSEGMRTLYIVDLQTANLDTHFSDQEASGLGV